MTTIFKVMRYWKMNQSDLEETDCLDMYYEKADAVDAANMHALGLAERNAMRLTRRGNHWWLSEGGGEGTARMEIYLSEVPDD